ncbi:MAG: Asp23/Gls24 family envelope stress response protein [Firmicutes bacterium]|nr:Asp23/Gls24 family envelope stress response protein [Bacillota bacterium]
MAEAVTVSGEAKTNSIEVIALAGPAGTGKSHRALTLAHELEVDLIIDDGLLIKGSRILAGKSAKSEKLIFTATRRALFMDPEHVRDVRQRLELENPKRLLVLGISENMVRRIAENLGLPQPMRIMNIEEVATEKEMQTARQLRMVERRHVVPVLSLDVNRNKVGQFLDSFSVIFRRKNERQLIGENSVVRPAYSTLGKITIDESVIREICLKSAKVSELVREVHVTSLHFTDGQLTVDIGLNLEYGFELRPVLEKSQEAVYETLNILTGMPIRAINVTARDLTISEIMRKVRNLG